MTNDLTIRPLTPGEEDLAWAMIEPVFRSGETYAIDPAISKADALAYWLAERAYLAFDGGVPVGTFYIHRNRPGGGAHYCNCGFVTAPAAQGRGVARAMLTHAMREAKSLGFDAMVFNFVVASNARAVALWQSAGFEIVGRVPGAFRAGGQDADALVMFRRLGDHAAPS